MRTVEELSYEERSTFGECPVCKSPHGKACDGNQGIRLGLNIIGEIPAGGVHLGRLEKAPTKKEIRYF